MNLSTRPAVSTILAFPVKKGCDELEISNLTNGKVSPSISIVSFVLIVEREINKSPLDMSLNATGR